MIILDVLTLMLFHHFWWMLTNSNINSEVFKVYTPWFDEWKRGYCSARLFMVKHDVSGHLVVIATFCALVRATFSNWHQFFHLTSIFSGLCVHTGVTWQDRGSIWNALPSSFVCFFVLSITGYTLMGRFKDKNSQNFIFHNQLLSITAS